MTVIGLDIHSKNFTMASVDPQGHVLMRPTVAKTSEENLVGKLAKVKGPKVLVVEECELAQWIKSILEDRVAKLVICDPKQNSWISKSDYNDDLTSAIKLSHLYQGGYIKEIKHPNAAGAELRSLYVHFVDLTQQRTRTKNKLKSCFRRAGILAQGSGVYDKETEQDWLKKLRAHSHLQHRARQHYRLLRVLETSREQTLAKLKKCRRSEETYKNLQTLPGVGPVVALGYMAIIGTPRRFSTSNKLWKYAALGNCYHESDGTVYNKKRSKSGNRVLKWLVFRQFSGVMLQKRDCRFKRQQNSLRKRGLSKKEARRQVCRKMLATLRAIWMKGEAYRP